MSAPELRDAWLEAWAEVDRTHQEAKDSQGALLELRRLYSSLGEIDRHVINGVLADSVASASETLRYDALALIDEFKIREALPKLRELHSRLSIDSSPGAPFEAAKVRRILDRIER